MIDLPCPPIGHLNGTGVRVVASYLEDPVLLLRLILQLVSHPRSHILEHILANHLSLEILEYKK